MKRKITESIKEKKGITLIALVITIIVLLILAGVTIATLTGENGILTKATQAKETTTDESAIEKVRLEVLGSYGKDGSLEYGDLRTNLDNIEGILGVPDVITSDSFPLLVEVDGVNIEIDEKGNVLKGMPLVSVPPTVEVSENTKFKDSTSNNKVAVIPKGFSVSSVTTEQSIDKGLVITDGTNEFVWVPVETVFSETEAEATTNKAMAIETTSGYRGLLYNFTETSSTVIEGCTTTDSGYREPVYLDNETNGDSSEYNTVGITQESLQKEYNEMITSVIKYGGFYVSRYEIGWDETSENIVSKSGIMPTLSKDSQSYMWYGLYDVTKKYTKKSGTEAYFGSSMIWGSQWDAMLNWILTGEDAEKIVLSDDLKNTTSTTGNSETDKMNNIYDLLGCHMEWTIEGDNSNRIYRSTNYYRNTVYPASRGTATPITTDLYYVIGIYVGTRCTLYIK